MEVPLALVVNCPSVVLQGAFVTEGSAANVTVEHVTRVRRQHVSRQAGFACKGGITGVTLVRLVRAVCLHVSGQRLLVLELDATLGAGVGLGVLGVVQLLVHRQVILAAEGFGTMTAGELVILLVGPLVPAQAVAPLEGLAALAAHVLPVAGVGVHVRGEVLLHPGAVLAQRAAQLVRPSLGLPRPLLGGGRGLLQLPHLPLAEAEAGEAGLGRGHVAPAVVEAVLGGGEAVAVLVEDGLEAGRAGGVGVLGAAGVQGVAVHAAHVVLLVRHRRV